jgi:hypothetical protein
LGKTGGRTETAKANGLKRYLYIGHLFFEMHLAKTEEDYRNLLPLHMEASSVDPAAS